MIYLNWLKDFQTIAELSLMTDGYDESELVSFYEGFVEKYTALDQKFHFTEEISPRYVFDQLFKIYPKKNLPLYPIPFGVKDVFNTKVLGTAMGSEIWKGFNAGNNARIVDTIPEVGGIIFSKTTTAEFAVHHLPYAKTLNPRNTGHITGTSSAGSAAAVASGALPICLGTQTAASIIRPASFCGVYGFKPSFGAFDRTGVLKTADTLDTIGLLANDLPGLSNAFDALRTKGRDYPLSKEYLSNLERFREKETLRVAIISGEFNGYTNYAADVAKDFEEFCDTISRFDFIEIVSVSGEVDFIDSVHQLHDIIYTKSLAYYFEKEFRETKKMSEIMASMIARGKEIETAQYIDALQKQIKLAAQFNRVFDKCDFLVTPSTATTAPFMGKSEKDDTGLIWTFFGYPTVSLPIFKSDADGLPFGLQIVAKRYHDFPLLDFSIAIEDRLRQITK